MRICLENGATIDETIEIDKSTTVHVAASQGSLEIIKLMSEMQTDIFSIVIQSEDSMGMTPMHRAAMFDHVDVCEFLISKGADIDALDKEKRTPLLLAASRNCVKMICYLLQNNANTRIKDSKMCNMIHLIIKQDPQCLNTEVLGKFNANTINSFEKIIDELLKVEVSFNISKFIKKIKIEN